MPVRNHRLSQKALRRRRRQWLIASLWALMGASPLVAQDNAVRHGDVDFSRIPSTSSNPGKPAGHTTSESGDIPASPWSHRNNPTRPGMIKQPSSMARQPLPASNKQIPARLVSNSVERKVAPESHSGTTVERPATVRWGLLRSMDPGRESFQEELTISPNQSLRSDRSSQREPMGEISFSRSVPVVPEEPTFEWQEDSGESAQDEPNIPPRSFASGPKSISVEPLSNTSTKNRPTRVQAAAQPVSNRKPSTSTIDGDEQPIAISDSPTLQRTHQGSAAPTSVPPALSPMAPAEREREASVESNDPEVPRLKLAQRISHELLSQSAAPSVRAPQILERPAGWDSIRSETKMHLEQCDNLLRRGAVHSARAEVISGLRRLYRTMDLYRGSFTSEPALESALLAFKEEADFHLLRGGSVSGVASTHATPALQSRPLEHVSPEVASQHYRAFARYELIKASDGHPWASPLLYALGKTFEREADLDADNAIRLRSQAVVCYQAAVQIQPMQSEASNQLGFALMHLDRIDEAYEALRHSIQARPNSQAWSNLAEVYRRRGSNQEAQYAIQQAVSLHREPEFSAENPQVTELDPAVFAKYSPMPNIQPAPPAATMPGNSQLYTQATPAASPMAQTASKSSFFSKIFR